MYDNKKFWSRNARLYECFTKSGKSAKRAYDEMEVDICAHLDHKMHVLELAAGPGIMSAKIADTCGSLEVTDFSPKMLEEAKKKEIHGEVHFAVADATELSYEDDSFDAVVIANALHIMPNPIRALAEIKRVLKPEGILIAPTFTREHVESKLVLKLMELMGFRTYSKWSHDSFCEFIESQGKSK